MKRMSRLSVVATMVVAVALLVAACGSDLDPLEDRVSSVEQDISQLKASVTSLSGGSVAVPTPPGRHHFYLTGVEWKGTTSADKLEAPGVDPTTLSNGYRFKDVGFDESNPANWQVASYVWTPGAMVVSQGDAVDLTAFVVNGDNHHNRLVATDGTQVGDAIDMNRGREYTISFTADQTGVYRLVCDTHGPSMTADILVLPSG